EALLAARWGEAAPSEHTLANPMAGANVDRARETAAVFRLAAPNRLPVTGRTWFGSTQPTAARASSASFEAHCERDPARIRRLAGSPRLPTRAAWPRRLRAPAA